MKFVIKGNPSTISKFQKVSKLFSFNIPKIGLQVGLEI